MAAPTTKNIANPTTNSCDDHANKTHLPTSAHIANSTQRLKTCLESLNLHSALPKKQTRHLLLLIEDAATLPTAEIDQILSLYPPQENLTYFHLQETEPTNATLATNDVTSIDWPKFVDLCLSCDSCTTW